jgi:preprotein translocase subunit YajC
MNQLFANLSTLMAAPADQAGGGSVVVTIITFGLIFVIFYFLIIRPQNKQKKETQKMIDAVKKGDHIVTIGGIHGTVQSVKESEVVIKVDSNSKMTMSRNAISSVKEGTRPTKKAEVEADVETEAEAESEESTEDES